MEQKTEQEEFRQYSSDRAVAWARQMMARKRVEQKRMAEEYKNNPKAQALIAELRQRNKQE